MSRRLVPVLAAVAGTLVACADPSAQQRAEELLATNNNHHGGARTSTESLPNKAMTVEQLGAELGCTPKPAVKAADFHQATCKTDQGELLLLDFTTTDSQRVWLDQALDYGNTYLVGDRWILGAPTPEALTELRKQLGGAIEGTGT